MSKLNLRQQQAIESRQKLVDSAQKLFAEKGYKGTSVRQINRDSNLADGILYHYFPGGKREIFSEIVCANLQQMHKDMQEQYAGCDIDQLSVAEILDKLYSAFVMTINDHLDIIRILIKENEVSELITKEQRLSLQTGGAMWLPKLLEERSEKGEIRKMDYMIEAKIIYSMLYAHIFYKIFNTEPATLDDPKARAKLIRHQMDLWAPPS